MELSEANLLEVKQKIQTSNLEAKDKDKYLQDLNNIQITYSQITSDIGSLDDQIQQATKAIAEARLLKGNTTHLSLIEQKALLKKDKTKRIQELSTLKEKFIEFVTDTIIVKLTIGNKIPDSIREQAKALLSLNQLLLNEEEKSKSYQSDIIKLQQEAKLNQAEINDLKEKYGALSLERDSLLDQIDSLKLANSELVKEYQEQLEQKELELQKRNELIEDLYNIEKQYQQELSQLNQKYKDSLAEVESLKFTIETLQNTIENLQNQFGNESFKSTTDDFSEMGQNQDLLDALKELKEFNKLTIEKFRGDPEKVTKWLDDFETESDNLGWEDSTKLKKVVVI